MAASIGIRLLVNVSVVTRRSLLVSCLLGSARKDPPVSSLLNQDVYSIIFENRKLVVVELMSAD